MYGLKSGLHSFLVFWVSHEGVQCYLKFFLLLLASTFNLKPFHSMHYYVGKRAQKRSMVPREAVRYSDDQKRMDNRFSQTYVWRSLVLRYWWISWSSFFCFWLNPWLLRLLKWNYSFFLFLTIKFSPNCNQNLSEISQMGLEIKLKPYLIYSFYFCSISLAILFKLSDSKSILQIQWSILFVYKIVFFSIISEKAFQRIDLGR